jgi:hypothetical protein
MTDPEKLFNETHARYMRSWSVVHNFRDSFAGVAADVGARLQTQAEVAHRNFVIDSVAKNQVEFVHFDQTLAKSAADFLLTASYSALDAAALIFHHSILDGAVFDYCRVTAMASPQDWAQDLKETRIALSEIQNSTYEQILRNKLNDRLARLERESLPEKINRLFSRCQPPSGYSPITGYAFDAEKIEKFDLQRHQIVHGNAIDKPLTLFQATEENLFYLLQTGVYFMGLVAQRYKLHLNPLYIIHYLQGKTAPI